MRFRLAASVVVVALVALALAGPAGAIDNGEGLLGETNDKVVTAFGLGLVLFFPLLIWLLSAIQGALERRKERHREAALRRRTGW
jgi:hypothetical protein